MGILANLMRGVGVVLLGTVALSGIAAAQADFYKGKTIELIISTGVGGGLDANARMVARHLSKHIPGNPTIVAKNMPGAGHVRAANYIYNQAPKDGTTIGTLIPAFVDSPVASTARTRSSSTRPRCSGSLPLPPATQPSMSRRQRALTRSRTPRRNRF